MTRILRRIILALLVIYKCRARDTVKLLIIKPSQIVDTGFLIIRGAEQKPETPSGQYLPSTIRIGAKYQLWIRAIGFYRLSSSDPQFAVLPARASWRR